MIVKAKNLNPRAVERALIHKQMRIKYLLSKNKEELTRGEKAEARRLVGFNEYLEVW